MRIAWLLPIASLFVVTPIQAQGSTRHWARSWAAAAQAPLSLQANRPIPDLADRTIRQVVRLSSGGAGMRLRLSNEMSDKALRVGSVRVAVAGADGKIVAGSSRTVTFDGRNGALVPAHAPAVSDVVRLSVNPLERLAVSIYFPTAAPAPTVHSHAAATAWIASGDQTDAVALSAPMPFAQRLVIAAVDVESAGPVRTVVAYGDSITDGAKSTTDADMRYPDQLAERLVRGGVAGVGVANAGIGGNRLLEDGTGPNALARFDRDVLSVPGVSHVIVLEGVNDIGTATRDHRPLPTPDIIEGAYRQMIARAHDRGVKVLMATITPYKGAGYWSAEGEAVRAAVNSWIRLQHEADGVVDFDSAVRSAADPQHIDPRFDGGDALHPNDAGFTAMTKCIDLRLLR